MEFKEYYTYKYRRVGFGWSVGRLVCWTDRWMVGNWVKKVKINIFTRIEIKHSNSKITKDKQYVSLTQDERAGTKKQRFTFKKIYKEAGK